jgi:hypothetical protein
LVVVVVVMMMGPGPGERQPLMHPGSHSRHSDRAKKTTSPSMLLSLDRPSPGAAAAATLLLGDADELAGPVLSGSGAVVVVDAEDAPPVVVPLTGEWSTDTVKVAGCVDVAEKTVGRLQVVVGEVVQSAVAWATASGIGLVSCAWARVVVVAPRAARMWEGRIGFGQRRRCRDKDDLGGRVG